MQMIGFPSCQRMSSITLYAVSLLVLVPRKSTSAGSFSHPDHVTLDFALDDEAPAKCVMCGVT